MTSHLRSTMPHRPTTVAEHMPSSHRRYRDWTHEHIRRDAARIGSDADALIDIILRSRPYPEQASFAIWILGLVKRYGPERVDAAGARAHLLNARSYKSVAAILRSGTRTRRRPQRRTHPFSFIPTSVAVATATEREIVMLIHLTVERLRALGLTP